MNVNNNSMDLSLYRGEVRPCPLCSNLTPIAKLDRLSSGKVCTMCLGNGYIAMCKNCDGTGQYSGRTVWDGGRSEHKSTCNPCGGKGAFPARKPAGWVDRQDESKPSTPNGSQPPDPVSVLPKNLPPPVTMHSGTILPGGVSVK
jgi:hypothetical protein